MQKRYHIAGPGFKYFCIYFMMPLLISFAFVGCEGLSDSLRNWGERGRRPAKARLDEAQVARWERDLNLSRARALELHDDLQDLVQESNRQGMLAWNIGKAYLNAGRYDLAALHYQQAIQGEPPERLAAIQSGQTAPGVATFEQALPYFEEALLRHSPDPELLFEAGLCFANASRAAGWERNRWRTAVLLFERMRRVAPDDIRSRYQLALLYGKTSDSAARDIPRAIDYLEEVVRREERDIPARFLLGQLLVQSGDFDRARAQYSRIMEILEKIHDQGLAPGPASGNPRYQQARENLEVLEACAIGSNDCAL
ncbi:MAG: tetratricopeptide repeat protein [bacterium]|nr:tetratricopeptide repeat protein [bacterium]